MRYWEIIGETVGSLTDRARNEKILAANRRKAEAIRRYNAQAKAAAEAKRNTTVTTANQNRNTDGRLLRAKETLDRALQAANDSIRKASYRSS